MGLAFRTVPAREANAAIAKMRDEIGEGEEARSYELVFDADFTWDAFVGEALPKLVYHLESIGARPPSCNGVVISLFAGEWLHFIDAKAFLELVCRLLAITPAELLARYGTGELRTAVRAAPPLLLGGPPDPSRSN